MCREVCGGEIDSKDNICAEGRSWQGVSGWNKHPNKMAG